MWLFLGMPWLAPAQLWLRNPKSTFQLGVLLIIPLAPGKLHLYYMMTLDHGPLSPLVCWPQEKPAVCQCIFYIVWRLRMEPEKSSELPAGSLFSLTTPPYSKCLSDFWTGKWDVDIVLSLLPDPLKAMSSSHHITTCTSQTKPEKGHQNTSHFPLLPSPHILLVPKKRKKKKAVSSPTSSSSQNLLYFFSI
jgi:hypothetical protein